VNNPVSKKTILNRLLRRCYAHLPTPPSTNFRSGFACPRPHDLLPEKALILDIGAKDARANYFGPLPAGVKVITIDIQPGPGVDIVADAQDLAQIPSECADCVFVVSVLQHVPAPWKVVSEAFRVLKPGGVIYVNAPVIFIYHRDPDDYYRFSVRGLEQLCSCFDKVASGSNRGPASTFCDIFIRFISILLSFNSETLYSAFVYCGKWTFFWIKYLDILISRYRVAYLMWGAPYFLGRKPTCSPALSGALPTERQG
jgi:SAM-dependent methyltransferase